MGREHHTNVLTISFGTCAHSITWVTYVSTLVIRPPVPWTGPEILCASEKCHFRVLQGYIFFAQIWFRGGMCTNGPPRDHPWGSSPLSSCPPAGTRPPVPPAAGGPSPLPAAAREKNPSVKTYVSSTCQNGRIIYLSK